MLAYVFVALAIGLRFLTAPMAFTSMSAALLYFGARGDKRRAWIPLAMAVGADVLLTRSVYSYPLTWDHLLTWIWYGAVLLMGMQIGPANKWLRIAAAGLASSVGFFLISNFGVWAAWSMYPKTLAGLGACYVAAIPFYRTALASDLVFTAVFFGLPAVLPMLAGKEAAV